MSDSFSSLDKSLLISLSFLRDLSDCTGTDLGIYISKFNVGKSYVQLEKKTIRNCQKLKSKYGDALIINQQWPCCPISMDIASNNKIIS